MLLSKMKKRTTPMKRDSASSAAMQKRLKSILSKVISTTKIKVRTFTKSNDKTVACFRTSWQAFDDAVTGRVSKKTGMTKPGSGKGLPKGKIIEIYGPESTGKTTLALQLIAAVQKQGMIGALIDAEYAFDPDYTENLGVNVENLITHQPDCAEDALDLTLALARQGVDLIVLDSVAALVPKVELGNKAAKATMGLQARLMSANLRKLARICGRSGSTVIFINQLRMKIGVMFGNPETTSGGNALKFYSSVRCDLRKVKIVKQGRVALGTIVRCKFVKNKVSTPMREVYLKLRFTQGIVGVEEGYDNKKSGSDDSDD